MSLFRKFLNWFTGKGHKEQLKHLKEIIPETPPPPKIQIRTIQDVKAVTQIKTFRDVKAFCEEMRKTLTIYKNSCEKMRDASWVHKKAAVSLYVEVGNLAGKIDRLKELLNEKETDHSIEESKEAPGKTH